MQFYKHSHQFRPPLPKHEVVRTVTLKEDQAKCLEERKSTRELLELQNCELDLERALLGRTSVRASPWSLESQGAVGEEGVSMTCFKCGEAVHFRRNCPYSVPQSGTGIPAVDESCYSLAAVQDSGQEWGEVHPRIPTLCTCLCLSALSMPAPIVIISSPICAAQIGSLMSLMEIHTAPL